MPSRLTPIAKVLRTNMTDAERLLWRHLRAGRFEGFKFRRQQPLGNFVVDFACFEAKLVIELDGGQHALAVKEDIARDTWLKGQGFHVLRFWNNEVFENMNGVLEKIAMEFAPPLSDTLSPAPSPVKGEGKHRLGKVEE